MLQEASGEVVLMEIRTTGVKNPEKVAALQRERKYKMINLYFSILNSFLLRSVSEGVNVFVDEEVVSLDFHKILLAYSIEAVLYILNISKIDFAAIVDVVGLSPVELYATNLKTLNFEQFLPNQLKKHFFNVENLLVSSLIWRRGSPLLSHAADASHRLIIERVLLYASAQISGLAKDTMITDETSEIVWNLVRLIVQQRNDLLRDRYLDQLVMCTFYSICKVFKFNIRF